MWYRIVPWQRRWKEKLNPQKCLNGQKIWNVKKKFTSIIFGSPIWKLMQGNLAAPSNAAPESQVIQMLLNTLLKESWWPIIDFCCLQHFDWWKDDGRVLPYSRQQTKTWFQEWFHESFQATCDLFQRMRIGEEATNLA